MSSRFTSPKSTFLPQLHHTEDKPGIALAGQTAGPLVINDSVGSMICLWFAEALGNQCNLSNLHCSTMLRTSKTLWRNCKIYRKNGLKPRQVSPSAFFVPSILWQHSFKLCFFSVLLFSFLPLPISSPEWTSSITSTTQMQPFKSFWHLKGYMDNPTSFLLVPLVWWDHSAAAQPWVTVLTVLEDDSW